MQVFYCDIEQGYRPRSSFIYGRFTPNPEVPERATALLEALRGRPGFEFVVPPLAREEWLEQAHTRDYLQAVATVCEKLKPDEEFFAFNLQRLPLLLRSPFPKLRVGYYALDGSTPLRAESYRTSVGVAAAAVAGAKALLAGAPVAYALMRPPGHHAGRETYGGYCLVNYAAVAAQMLLERGKVAILDLDYHHGNGSQDIFWARDDVLYVSLHCRPEEAYPYVAGSTDEVGAGRGRGFNVNLPLPGGTEWTDYAAAMETAMETLARFRPDSLVLSLGFDTLATDPIGSFRLQVPDYEAMGHLVAQIGLPTLVVQEGGYDVSRIGACAQAFFAGLGVAAP